MTTEYQDLIRSPGFQHIIEQGELRKQANAESEAEAEQHGGKIFDLTMKRASLKLEQNLGCELPVCVASHHETKRSYIEVVTDAGVIWRLTRESGGYLPAPEHYAYWLWFLDRCQAASEQGYMEPPRVVINPGEIFDLFGAPKKGKKSGYQGWRYDALDAAFSRFSSLTIRKRGAFFDGNRVHSGDARLGTLCYYMSWRADSTERQIASELLGAWVKPGPLLWDSIKHGYLKSVPLDSLKHLTYVEQRLFTYLAKHCKPGCIFAVAPEKLLPKIPLHCPTNKLKHKLGPRHEALAKIGFLSDARVEGRGRSKLLVYRRSKKTK